MLMQSEIWQLIWKNDGKDFQMVYFGSTDLFREDRSPHSSGAGTDFRD